MIYARFIIKIELINYSPSKRPLLSLDVLRFKSIVILDRYCTISDKMQTLLSFKSIVILDS